METVKTTQTIRRQAPEHCGAKSDEIRAKIHDEYQIDLAKQILKSI